MRELKPQEIQAVSGSGLITSVLQNGIPLLMSTLKTLAQVLGSVFKIVI